MRGFIDSLMPPAKQEAFILLIYKVYLSDKGKLNNTVVYYVYDTDNGEDKSE